MKGWFFESGLIFWAFSSEQVRLIDFTTSLEPRNSACRGLLVRERRFMEHESARELQPKRNYFTR
jgi:hypothetical protein